MVSLEVYMYVLNSVLCLQGSTSEEKKERMQAKRHTSPPITLLVAVRWWPAY